MNTGSRYQRDPHHHLEPLTTVPTTGLHMHPKLSLSCVTYSTGRTRCQQGKLMIFLISLQQWMRWLVGRVLSWCTKIYGTIDATSLGDTPWNHFNLNYLGEQNENRPSWQMDNFTVWFCNPLTVIHNLLFNSDFDGGFDYSPFQECDKDNNHQYENFMSRNWCWKQAVCLID